MQKQQYVYLVLYQSNRQHIKTDGLAHNVMILTDPSNIHWVLLHTFFQFQMIYF